MLADCTPALSKRVEGGRAGRTAPLQLLWSRSILLFWDEEGDEEHPLVAQEEQIRLGVE